MVGAWFYQHVARDRSCSLQLLWWQWAFLKNVGVVSSCAPCGVTTLHVFPCWSRTPPSWLGHSFTKAVTWKHEKQSRCITWSLCLEGAVSDRSIAEVQDRTLRDEWLAKRSAGSDSRLPSWFRVSCSLCCSSSWDTELWNRKAPCASLSLPRVCVQPGFLKSTKRWGAQGSASVWETKMQKPGMGEEVSVWRSKQRGWEVSRRQFQAC